MSEKVNYYLDEQVDSAVAKGLRRRGVNVVRAFEVGMLGATDPEHLRLALKVHRVIFTQDEDFNVLHAAGEPHAGIVYAPQGTAIGPIIRGLMLIYDVLSAEEMIGRLEYL